jgi:hypothetical protein
MSKRTRLLLAANVIIWATFALLVIYLLTD